MQMLTLNSTFLYMMELARAHDCLLLLYDCLQRDPHFFASTPINNIIKLFFVHLDFECSRHKQVRFSADLFSLSTKYFYT
jgi:hypothetical protein